MKKLQIKGLDVAKGVTVIALKKNRHEIMNEVEKLLLEEINEKQLTDDSISPKTICKKA